MLFWDYTYIFVLIGAAICAMASWNVTRVYNKFGNVCSRRGQKAEDVAAMMLRQAGITDVRIERIKGNLTDHYSPKEKVLRLSDSVYGSTSVAAIGVAAHECGHAIQHHRKYLPLSLRSASVPLANIGSRIYWPIIVFGLLLDFMQLAQLGVLLFGFVVLFQLITLPVEFNASARAMETLSQGILMDDELTGAGKVLRAAAMTYVASLFSSIFQLLRLVLLTRRRDD